MNTQDIQEAVEAIMMLRSPAAPSKARREKNSGYLMTIKRRSDDVLYAKELADIETECVVRHRVASPESQKKHHKSAMLFRQSTK